MGLWGRVRPSYRGRIRLLEVHSPLDDSGHLGHRTVYCNVANGNDTFRYKVQLILPHSLCANRDIVTVARTPQVLCTPVSDLWFDYLADTFSSTSVAFLILESSNLYWAIIPAWIIICKGRVGHRVPVVR